MWLSFRFRLRTNSGSVILLATDLLIIINNIITATIKAIHHSRVCSLIDKFGSKFSDSNTVKPIQLCVILWLYSDTLNSLGSITRYHSSG